MYVRVCVCVQSLGADNVRMFRVVCLVCVCCSAMQCVADYCTVLHRMMCFVFGFGVCYVSHFSFRSLFRVCVRMCSRACVFVWVRACVYACLGFLDFFGGAAVAPDIELHEE